MEEALVEWVMEWVRCEADVGAVERQRTGSVASRPLRRLVEVEWVVLDAISTRQAPARASAMEKPSSQILAELKAATFVYHLPLFKRQRKRARMLCSRASNKELEHIEDA